MDEWNLSLAQTNTKIDTTRKHQLKVPNCPIGWVRSDAAVVVGMVRRSPIPNSSARNPSVRTMHWLDFSCPTLVERVEGL